MLKVTPTLKSWNLSIYLLTQIMVPKKKFIMESYPNFEQLDPEYLTTRTNYGPKE